MNNININIKGLKNIDEIKNTVIANLTNMSFESIDVRTKTVNKNIYLDVVVQEENEKYWSRERIGFSENGKQNKYSDMNNIDLEFDLV